MLLVKKPYKRENKVARFCRSTANVDRRVPPHRATDPFKGGDASCAGALQARARPATAQRACDRIAPPVTGLVIHSKGQRTVQRQQRGRQLGPWSRPMARRRGRPDVTIQLGKRCRRDRIGWVRQVFDPLVARHAHQRRCRKQAINHLHVARALTGAGRFVRLGGLVLFGVRGRGRVARRWQDAMAMAGSMGGMPIMRGVRRGRLIRRRLVSMRRLTGLRMVRRPRHHAAVAPQRHPRRHQHGEAEAEQLVGRAGHHRRRTIPNVRPTAPSTDHARSERAFILSLSRAPTMRSVGAGQGPWCW